MPSTINYSKIPVPYMEEAVQAYIERGRPCGHFLTALFSNDLEETFRRADETNQAAISKWLSFMYWEMPTGSHGSLSNHRSWIERGGLEGIEANESKPVLRLGNTMRVIPIEPKDKNVVDALLEAHKQGYDHAYVDCGTSASNPYNRSTHRDLHFAWLNGYDEGFKKLST